MADYSSDVTFVCPICSNEVTATVLVPEPCWTADRAEDRVVQDIVEFACPSCQSDLEADVTNSDNVVEMEFTEYPAVQIDCSYGRDRSPDPDDDWWRDVPSEPGDIFKDSISDALDLLSEHGTDFGLSTANQMVFVHLFAALEAYLGDTLLNYINANDDALERLLTNDSELKERKISLIEALKNDDVVFEIATDHLKGLLYHNLAKVSVMFKMVAAIDIFPDDAVKQNLHKAVPLRHDCVHRNGYDKAGNKHLTINRAYVQQIGADMTKMVDHIDGLIAAQTT